MAERGLTNRAAVRRQRLRMALKLVAAVLTVWLLWLAAPKALNRVEFFRVRRVEIAGVQYLAPAKVITSLGLDPNATVFDDMTAGGRRLKALPGVVSADVRRRFPGTVEIALLEAIPVALAAQSGGMTVLDSGGNVLPFDPAASAPDLPVAARADRIVTRVLAAVQTHEPALFGRIRTAWRVREDVLLDVDGRRLWFSPTVTAEDIRAVMAVSQDLARQGRTYQELDGRYAGLVLVRART